MFCIWYWYSFFLIDLSLLVLLIDLAGFGGMSCLCTGLMCFAFCLFLVLELLACSFTGF